MASKLILFGCYWNEIDWIDISLKQIQEINPDEVILCDGCFDPNYELHSTDGTYEVIKKEVSRYSNYSLVDPVRIPKKKYHKIFPKLVREIGISGKYLIPLIRIYLSLYLHSNYRVNQAFTFNKMITQSTCWEPGNWMMTYDCDQFYSDKILDDFRSLDHFNDFDLLTATENTFFNSFGKYTDQWMDRERSNMPHKIKESTIFEPTRNILFLDRFNKYVYEYHSKTKHVGNYYHYKIKKEDRLKEGYQLGDRVKDIPEYDHLEFINIKESEHPKIIRDYIFKATTE